MTIIDCTLPPEKYIKQLEGRFKATAKRYREKTWSKLKIRSLVPTTLYGLNNDLLLTIEVSQEIMLGVKHATQTIQTSNGLESDNIALLIEREIFLRHRWFLRIVTELSKGNYYEHYARQIDPSDDVVCAGRVLEATIFVQKPVMNVTASLAYCSRGYCALP